MTKSNTVNTLLGQAHYQVDQLVSAIRRADQGRYEPAIHTHIQTCLALLPVITDMLNRASQINTSDYNQRMRDS